MGAEMVSGRASIFWASSLLMAEKAAFTLSDTPSGSSSVNCAANPAAARMVASLSTKAMGSP